MVRLRGARTHPPRQKLVLFTEHRDTLNYVEARITTLLGRKEAVVIIHGGMGRYSLNKPDDFILAIVEFLDGDSHRVHYLRQPFGRDPDFGVTSVNYDFAELLARAAEPS